MRADRLQWNLSAAGPISSVMRSTCLPPPRLCLLHSLRAWCNLETGRFQAPGQSAWWWYNDLDWWMLGGARGRWGNLHQSSWWLLCCSTISFSLCMKLFWWHVSSCRRFPPVSLVTGKPAALGRIWIGSELGEGGGCLNPRGTSAERLAVTWGWARCCCCQGVPLNCGCSSNLSLTVLCLWRRFDLWVLQLSKGSCDGDVPTLYEIYFTIPSEEILLPLGVSKTQTTINTTLTTIQTDVREKIHSTVQYRINTQGEKAKLQEKVQ